MRRFLADALVFVAGCRTGIDYSGAVGPRYGGTPPRAATTGACTKPCTLRVVSFNVEFARQIDGAIALLTSETGLRGADIVLLQEMDASGARPAQTLDMAWVYYPAIFHKRSGKDVGNAVLSRWPMEADAKLVLPHVSRYARTHRIATAATIRVGDARVRVYSTHLGTPLDFGFTWPTREGPRTTTLGRWDHVFLKGLASPDTGSSGTLADARGVSDHRAVWTLAILP